MLAPGAFFRLIDKAFLKPALEGKACRWGRYGLGSGNGDNMAESSLTL